MKQGLLILLILLASSLQAQMEKNCTLLGSLAIQDGTDILVKGDYAYVFNIQIGLSISKYKTVSLPASLHPVLIALGLPRLALYSHAKICCSLYICVF